MLSIVDWIWWSVGAVIGLGGMVLTLRAMFADRSRGRRRCFKCWYEMTGIDSLRCPECGRVAKRERKLLRTRRHWRVAFLGVLILTIGGACFFGQRVHQEGWGKVTPTAAYIIGLPWMDTQSTFDELDRRVEEEQLARWETWLLVHRCIGQLGRDSSPDRLARTANTLGQVEMVGRRIQAEGPWADATLASEVDCDGAIDALVSLFDHEDPKVQAAAVGAVGRFDEAAVSAFPALIGVMWRDDDARPFSEAWITLMTWGYFDPRFSGDPPPDGAFCQRLGECATDRDRAAQVFREGLAYSDVGTRALAVNGVALFGRNDDLGRIASLADDPKSAVRIAVIRALSAFPYDNVVAGIIARGLHDPNIVVQRVAFKALGERGAEDAGREFVDELEIGLRQRRDVWIEQGAATYVHLGGDPEVAIDALLDGLTIGRPIQLLIRLRQLATLGVESDRARDRVEQVMRDGRGETKGFAAWAYAMLGGDPDVATSMVIDVRSGSLVLGLDYPAAFAESERASLRVLIETLESDVPRRRALAVEMLGLVGADAAAALPTLRGLSDDDDDVRVAEHARRAIRRIEWELEHE